MSYSIVKVGFDRILLLFIFPLHSNRVYIGAYSWMPLFTFSVHVFILRQIQEVYFKKVTLLNPTVTILYLVPFLILHVYPTNHFLDRERFFSLLKLFPFFLPNQYEQYRSN